MAPSLYVVIYAGAVLLSLPEAAVLTVAGGLLFGTLFGGILAVVGSSAGAIALFLAVRYHLADAIAARGGRFLDRRPLRPASATASAICWRIRLVPAFPFWLVNLAAALSGMRLLPYAAATVLGIMPATFVYRLDRRRPRRRAGDRRAVRTSRVIFSPRILGPLIGLAACRCCRSPGALEAVRCLISTWR